MSNLPYRHLAYSCTDTHVTQECVRSDRTQESLFPVSCHFVFVSAIFEMDVIASRQQQLSSNQNCLGKSDMNDVSLKKRQNKPRNRKMTIYTVLEAATVAKSASGSLHKCHHMHYVSQMTSHDMSQLTWNDSIRIVAQHATLSPLHDIPCSALQEEQISPYVEQFA